MNKSLVVEVPASTDSDTSCDLYDEVLAFLDDLIFGDGPTVSRIRVEVE